MSVQPVLRLDRLFIPGARLGWVFRDLHRLTAPFPEAEPDPGHIRDQVAARAVTAQTRYARARRWLIKSSLAMGLILLILAGYDEGRHHTTAAAVLLFAAIVAAGGGPGYTARSWWRQRRAHHRPVRARVSPSPGCLAAARRLAPAGRTGPARTGPRLVQRGRPAAAGGGPLEPADQQPSDPGRSGGTGTGRMVRTARGPGPLHSSK